MVYSTNEKDHKHQIWGLHKRDESRNQELKLGYQIDGIRLLSRNLKSWIFATWLLAQE